MKVAIFGGSFNPPHVGHGMVAAWLRWTEQVEEVWLVPTFSHPFAKQLLPYKVRVELCHALCEVAPGLRVSEVESTLPVPSYSIDTLQAVRTQHPQHQFQLVIGADILQDVHKWKQWDRIASEFSPIIVGRGGYDPVEGQPTFPTVSSSQVRSLWSNGGDVGRLIPASVLEVLRAHNVRFI